MRKGFQPTGKINAVLKANALGDDIRITWDWRHLDNWMTTTSGDLGVNGDARGVLEWLCQRNGEHGFHSAFTTDRQGCLNRLFFEVKGARDRWTRSVDGKMVIFDATHGTNEYGMKVACFTTLDREARTQLLAVSILQREDTPSFAWAFKQFNEAMADGPEPEKQNPVDIIFTDSDPAMAAAIRYIMPGECVCPYK